MPNRLSGELVTRGEAHALPFDAALPGMALLQQPEQLREVLSHHLAAWLGPGIRPLDARIAVRRYVPGKRCSAELELVLGPARAAHVERRQVMGKFYSDGVGAAAYETLWQLRNNGFGAGRFLVPRLLGYDTDHRLLLLDWAHGESLASRLDASSVAWESVTAAAAWLVRLHGCGVTCGGHYTRSQHLRTLTGWTHQLTERYPEGRRLLAELQTAISERSHELSDWTPGPTHRDFSPEHLVSTGVQLVGLDLDEFCQYDPLYDVAHFTAQLRFISLIRYGALHYFDRLADRFVACYRAGAGEDSEERRRLYEAIACVKLGRFVALVRPLPNWRRVLPALLGEARGLM
jgi:hypothetical protein